MNKKGYLGYTSIVNIGVVSAMLVFGFLMFFIFFGTTGQLEINIDRPYHTEYKQCSSELDDLEDSFQEFKEAKIENVCPNQKGDPIFTFILVVVYLMVGFIIGNAYGGNNKPKKKRGKRK